MKTKVCLVGTGPACRFAPFGDEDYDVWTMNASWSLGVSDAHFQMHNPERENILALYDADYVAWLEHFEGPVYTLSKAEWMPGSTPFPIEEMTQEFGDLWGCSFAYMIALAISRGYAEIAIAGVDLITSDEYQAQRESVLYFIGQARGRGITVSFPGGSHLEARGIRYGYQEPPVIPDAAKESQARELAMAQRKHDMATADLYRAEGAAHAYQYVGRADLAAQAHKAMVQAQAERERAEGGMSTARHMGLAFAHIETGGR